MIFEELSALRRRISEVTNREVPSKLNIFEDTSKFMSIDAGDVLRLSGNDYFILGYAREGRFGIDEQPKFWVMTAVDLTTGAKRIIKMVFNEMFDCLLGETRFHCVRNPGKEAEVLREMSGHSGFMHGQAVHDAAGNLVRILEVVSGPSLYSYLRDLKTPHKEYYYHELSGVMQLFIKAAEAIALLHRKELHHGDIRADHIIIDSRTGIYVWIDFDYQVSIPYDVLCLGNVLHQVVGKGRHSLEDIRLQPSDYPDFKDTLTASDMSLMRRHRVANLRKLYPYLSADLNEILMRFSAGATDLYKDVDSLIDDLRLCFR